MRCLDLVMVNVSTQENLSNKTLLGRNDSRETEPHVFFQGTLKFKFLMTYRTSKL